MTATATGSLGLAPLCTALLGRGRADGDGLRAAAQAEAATLVATARAEAEATLTAARQLGVRDGTARLRLDESRVRRDNRLLVLHAQRATYQDVVQQARTAVGELLAEGPVHDQLVAGIRRRLGPGAAVHPAPGGGSVGQSPQGRSVDASVEALVEQALGAVDLEPLWTSS